MELLLTIGGERFGLYVYRTFERFHQSRVIIDCFDQKKMEWRLQYWSQVVVTIDVTVLPSRTFYLLTR